MKTHINQNPVKPISRENFNNNEISQQNPARAFCRVFIGGFERAIPYLQESMQYFGNDRKSLSERTSFMIVDADSTNLLKMVTKKLTNPDQTTSLYEQLLEYGVTFININELREFLTQNGKTDYFHKVMSTIKENIRFENSEPSDYFHAFSDAYKLFCISYAFSNNTKLRSVAAIDIDSIAPIHPPETTALSGKIPSPMSLKTKLSVNLDQQPPIPSQHFVTDINFLTQIYHAYAEGMVVKEPLKLSITKFPNFSFTEVCSKKSARQMQNNLQDSFHQLHSEKQWLWINETGKNSGPHTSLDNIPLTGNTPIQELCVDICVSPVNYTKAFYCQPICSTNPAQLQENVLLNKIEIPKTQTQLEYFLPWLKKNKMALFTNYHKHIPSLSQGLEKTSECKVLTKDDKLCFRIGDNIALLLNKSDIRALDKLFSEPLNSWHIRATEAHYQWSNFTDYNEPRIFPVLGKHHADQLIKGNISAIKSLTGLKPLPRENTEYHQVPVDASLPNEYTNHIESGIIAGVADEFCSRLSLTDYSLIHKTMRGYLFSGGPGCALGLVNHIYDRYMEPYLPDGKLKYACSHILPYSPLLVSIAHGNLIGTACTLASYTGTRRLIGTLLTPLSKHDNRSYSE